jgi:uncharacterized protein (TIGR04551 family)
MLAHSPLMSRHFITSSVFSLALGVATSALAAEAPASQPVDLNQQIVPVTPLPGLPSAAAGADLPPAEWNAEDWDVQKPQLNLFEIDGYFRVRPDMIINGSLGNNAPGLTFSNRIESAPDGSTLTTAAARDNIVAGANMRLRVQPTLNITEDIQLVAMFDVFDNLVLGSTPNSAGRSGNVVNILEIGQNSPNAGWNAARDAIQVRRVYGKVATPLGELRFGRQPNHWGLGMYANSGDCIDCDHGENVDRISFVGMLGSYYIVPMIDFMAEGPTSISNAQPWSYARDLDQLDDATQLSLQIAKKDAPEDAKEMLERGEVVFNWGLWNMFRFQSRENPRYYIDPTQTFDPNNPSTVITRQSRGAFGYTVDGWFKLQWRKLTIEMEAMFLYARFLLPNQGSATPIDTPSDQLEENKAFQWGGALDAKYDILPELYVRLRAGIASGDNTPGNYFGVGQNAYNKRSGGGVNDRQINNMQFNRDYRVDLILFRELIGTVSGAWYIKPEVSYTFANGLGGRFAPIYAQALYSSSTPGGKTPLGFELDFEAFFAPLKKRGFEASLQYGLYLPLDAGLRNPAIANGAPSIAHRLLGRMAVVF